MPRQRVKNSRNPLVLQWELRKKLEEEGKLAPADAPPQSGPPKPEPTPPPAITETKEKKAKPKVNVTTLSARDKLNALPNEDLHELAKLHLDMEEVKINRAELLDKLVKAGVKV